MNGTSIFSMTDNNNFNGANDLVIGNESIPQNQSAFGGYMTYFTWVKGVALYTSNFTVSNDYPTITEDYVLLLTANSFDGSLGSAVVNNNNNVSTVANVPPGFGGSESQSTPHTNLVNMRSMLSLFSNNANVYYKKGSLAPGGVGSVRNSSIKSRKT